MSVTIERSLYVGILKTRYDIFDDVTITLKNGQKLKGTIRDLGEDEVYLSTDDKDYLINVYNIEDCE
jgi:sRNA-binding regulator protein Hfq